MSMKLLCLALIFAQPAYAFKIQHCFPKDEPGFERAVIKKYFCVESEKLKDLEGFDQAKGVSEKQKTSPALKDLAAHIDKFLRDEGNGIKPIFDKTDKRITAQGFKGEVGYTIRYSPAATPCNYKVAIDSRLDGTKAGKEVYTSASDIKLKKMETRCLIDSGDPSLKSSAVRMGTELHNGLRKIKGKQIFRRLTDPFNAKSE